VSETLTATACAFESVEAVTGVQPYGTGHINHTYLVTCANGIAPRRFILQRINETIFRDVPALMENVVRVTQHLRTKYECPKIGNSLQTLFVVPTHEGASYHRDGEGHYWRMYAFIEGAHTRDVLETPEQAREAARAYAQFQLDLADLPDPPLHETLPQFHNGLKRFEAFESMVAQNPLQRAQTAREEIAYLYDQAPVLQQLPQALAAGELPQRTTHNDTKINNVMLDDRTGRGICVIDLDTVMPGLALYDYGDMVRTCVCPAAEDEQDLSRVVVDLEMFRALTEGYLERAADFLTQAERERLVLGARTIILIIGMRFLTDYLAGDAYFRIHRDQHNLDRCRTQFRLAQQVAAREEELERVVMESCTRTRAGNHA
jgi:Ser/Thr protein kinase RdoA (MazF antagonist)